MEGISIITIMRDEWRLAQSLGDSIRWCEDWHIVITDDKTSGLEPAFLRYVNEEWGRNAQIHHYPLALGTSFDAARAAALPHIKNEWILILDTDERVPDSTLQAIRSAIASERNPNSGFWLPRLNHVLGSPLMSRAYWPDWQLRLVRNNQVTFPSAIHGKYEVDGITAYFPEATQYAIHHFNFRSTDQFLNKLLTYSTIEARTGHSPSHAPIKALWRAIRYFLAATIKMRGLKDGNAGIHQAACMAFYTYISSVKRWEASISRTDAISEIDEPKR